MKAVLVSIKPKWCAKIMNGKKTIEVRTSKALANAIQKLIDKYGYADIYVYCTKDNKQGLVWDNRGKGLVNSSLFPYGKDCPEAYRLVNGKVVFKFRCYKVEEITVKKWNIYVENDLLKGSCLHESELFHYIGDFRKEPFYAIHISDLKVFDKPKELSEFHLWEKDKIIRLIVNNTSKLAGECLWKPLTKAPQNFCYVEVL